MKRTKRKSRWSIPVDEPARVTITVRQPRKYVEEYVAERLEEHHARSDYGHTLSMAWEVEYDFMADSSSAGLFLGDEDMAAVVARIMQEFRGEQLTVTTRSIGSPDGVHAEEVVEVSKSLGWKVPV